MKHLLMSLCIIYLLSACKDQQEQQSTATQQSQEAIAQQSLTAYEGLAWKVLTSLQAESDQLMVKEAIDSLIHSSESLFLAMKTQLPECEASLLVMADYMSKMKATKSTPMELTPTLPDFTEPRCYHAQQLLLNSLAVFAIAEQAAMTEQDYHQAKLKMIDSIARIKQLN
ncbi:hypothetical protein EXT42_14450 [Pseudoalteromonas sp. CO302Y]|uniref:hypothetical protein n=1 Tax=unclassified Pseudoalteromonas TaxID=194690 RepID=UPI0010236D46|nr:hypothetical protein EXT42_14450 [Pseudoalteromonas sp. CO302Y]RZG07032.1 hypothetical protein EXT40_15230 [Pseudoalteromonas sp. CO133X]